MQLTRAADYAVRVMIFLVSHTEERRVSLPAIAAATGAPESFLSKVLQALTRGGLLVSQRGQAGGFEVSHSGRESSMLNVIEAVDGPIRLNVCLTSGKSCARKAWCPAHPVWARAQEAMLAVLECARIEDLAFGSQTLDVRSLEPRNVEQQPLTDPPVLESVAEAEAHGHHCECVAKTGG